MTPKEFIKKGYNRDQLEQAVRQQKQIQYCVVSDVQQETSVDYIKKLGSVQYSGEDPLLSWVWSLFKKDNFKSFYKYLRFPVASSSIAKDEIEKSMERVFFADDSYSKYLIRGKEVQAPEYLDTDEFPKDVFNALMYRYNDILIHDIKPDQVNEPYRYLLDLEKVVSIKVEKNTIKKIAFLASIEVDGKEQKGHVYLDSEIMAFIRKEDSEPFIEIPHDINACPASFVSGTPFDDHKPVIRESIYSRARPLLEQYNFLTTLQLMSDSNGAFPIVVKLAADEDDQRRNDQHDLNYPMSSNGISGHHMKESESDLQPGTVITAPALMKTDGTIDTSIVEKYITFFRTPVDSLEYINKRILETRKKIIETVVGDFVEQSEESKNELQVSKSYLLKQDKLRAFGRDISFCISSSDTIMMKLANGEDAKAIHSSGTDFFIETQEDIYKQITIAPNPIEKNNLLKRLVRIRSSNNADKMHRDAILYMLLPYSTKGDFETALNYQTIGKNEILLQSKFHYFIAIFESKYGDILEFWREAGDLSDNEKLILTKDLLTLIVEEYGEQQSVDSDTQNDEVPARAN